MTNVKVRLKYFYAVSDIIMLLRENNRPSRVKGYLQEAGLFTHMPSWTQRVEQNVIQLTLEQHRVRGTDPAQSKF